MWSKKLTERARAPVTLELPLENLQSHLLGSFNPPKKRRRIA